MGCCHPILCGVLDDRSGHRQKAGATQQTFLSGRNMPWWLLGVSMVATTFQLIHLTSSRISCVTRRFGQLDLVGIPFNGHAHRVVYRLWRRSEVLTVLMGVGGWNWGVYWRIFDEGGLVSLAAVKLIPVYC